MAERLLMFQYLPPAVRERQARSVASRLPPSPDKDMARFKISLNMECGKIDEAQRSISFLNQTLAKWLV
jgi:hypothetical protein